MASAKDTARQLRKLAVRLERVADAVARGEASRDDLERIVAEFRALVARDFGPRPRAPSGQGARHRIPSTFKPTSGAGLKDELAAVSGIQEWARRVRELDYVR